MFLMGCDHTPSVSCPASGKCTEPLVEKSLELSEGTTTELWTAALRRFGRRVKLAVAVFRLRIKEPFLICHGILGSRVGATAVPE